MQTIEGTIHLTESAIRRIREVVEQEGVAGLRVGVQGGGCSGFTYLIKFETQQRPRDHIFEFDGVQVFVDPQSLAYLKGMTLDYKSELIQQGFVLQNPNAKQTCGCGISFSA